MILQTFAIALLLGQSPVAAVSATRFTPLYGLEKGQASLPVAAFRIDTRLVTQGEFAEFVRRNPEWSAKRVSRALADPQYLKPLAAADHQRFTSAPMVWVSYFAAQAFCHDKRDPADPAVRGRLPTTLEWEVVAAADAKRANANDDPEFIREILRWYERPARPDDLLLPGSPANLWGVSQVHGLVWEWTLDFNAYFVTQDNRQDGDTPAALFCGAGAQGSARREDYAAFMRYALRSSLQARNVLGNVGFRCAYDVGGLAP